MSKPHLVIREDGRGYSYRLVWHFPDAGEDGGILGEGGKAPKRFDRSRDYEQRETFALDRAIDALEFAERDDGGFWFESQSAARKALAVANAVIKSVASSKPWPEWAIKAKSAGWKAPKGWKP